MWTTAHRRRPTAPVSGGTGADARVREHGQRLLRRLHGIGEESGQRARRTERRRPRAAPGAQLPAAGAATTNWTCRQPPERIPQH
eukprot:6556967-Prymnesium_polylepis.2